MANSPQAAKRARQANKIRLRNHSMLSSMRTVIKKVLHAIESSEKENANILFREVQSKLDTYARKGLISKNKAGRTKSRLNARIKALA